MKRLFLLILIGTLTAGCKSQTPVTDPFFGRTTIPPPPTGSVSGRPSDPSFQPPPLGQPPAQAAPIASPPQVQLPAQPSGQSTTRQPLSQSTTGWPSGTATAPPAQPSTSLQLSTPQRPSTPSPGPNYSAPRPSSTAPAANSTSRGNPLRYPAPGAAVQNNARTTTAPLYNNVSATRTNAPLDNRMPGPVDDAAPAASAASRNPIVQTIQPRGVESTSNRPVDIADLPKIP
jgi:hypothetical protein